MGFFKKLQTALQDATDDDIARVRAAVNAQFTDEAVPLSADDLLLALALELVDADEEQRLWSDPG